MGYSEWFEVHAKKHAAIVAKLKSAGYSKESIIEYFCYENMKEKEKEFCPLYAQNRKCHDLEELNCYLCACSNFRFSDAGIDKQEGKVRYSYCSIDSKDGRVGVYGDNIHQDCSKCYVPHHKEYIKTNFDEDWKKVMQKCRVDGC